jgi:hypothetical protein
MQHRFSDILARNWKTYSDSNGIKKWCFVKCDVSTRQTWRHWCWVEEVFHIWWIMCNNITI